MNIEKMLEKKYSDEGIEEMVARGRALLARSEEERSAEYREMARLIGNCRVTNVVCALRRGASGMDDLGRVAVLIRKVKPAEAEAVLDLVDEVRAGLRYCQHCYMKFLAFAIHFTDGLFPERHSRYMSQYTKLCFHYRPERNYFEETRRRIPRDLAPSVVPPTLVRFFRSLE